jgi:hypothetical protein
MSLSQELGQLTGHMSKRAAELKGVGPKPNTWSLMDGVGYMLAGRPGGGSDFNKNVWKPAVAASKRMPWWQRGPAGLSAIFPLLGGSTFPAERSPSMGSVVGPGGELIRSINNVRQAIAPTTAPTTAPQE